MSLHKFADMVAQQGRGEDSLLIHMTPDEVQRLQSFAEANGRSLTINPETGLPEAGMLSDLFKAVAPIALGAFLGPGAFGIAGLGLSAGTAGLVTGGLTTLATGSLSRGLMAGLGAYGGAGLAEGLAGAGAGVLGQQASEATAMELANAGAGEALTGDAYNKAFQQSVTDKMAGADTFSAGLGAAKAAPMDFLKQNLGSISAAAAPIMAGRMVPTTTKMPENTSPAYIRQKLYDPYTQTYKSLAPVKASEWGSRSFSDAYTNPQTGIATLEQRPPTPMADGGIVALAGGGYTPTDTEIFDYFKTPGLTDAQIAKDMQTFGVSAADIARVTGTQNQQADYEKRFVNTLVAPGTDTSEFMAATKSVGLQDQALANAMQGAGLSAAGQYALTHPLSDAGGITGTDFYNNLGYTTGALPGDQGGLEGLYANINYSAKGLQDQINSGALTVAQAQDLALAEAARAGVSLGDIKAATGSTFGDLFTPKTVVKDTITGGGGKDTITGGGGNDTITGGGGNDTHQCASGYHWDGKACVPNVSATQNTTTTVTTPTSLITAPATSLPVGVSGTTGPSIFGGGATVNPNGTITTSPVIPGIPVGGFTGMEQVRDAYTKGGGSLGYTSRAPKTIDEFNQLYNKQTGDSLAAYDYLMGKGGGKYPVQSTAAATGIMRPYWSEGMRYKPKFLSYGKDGTIQSSTTSGGAGTTAAADLTTAKTINVIDANGNPDTATLGTDGKYHTSSGNTYDVTGAQIAADGGMMGYAMGGGLGSLGSYSDGGRLLKGPGDGVSDSIPATIGEKQQPARLANNEFVIPARIVSELGNGSTDAGAKKLYAMMDRVQNARKKSVGKGKVAVDSKADKFLPA